MGIHPGYLALALAAAVATPASAQSAAPIGYWTTPDNGERLLIEANTDCSFFAVGGTQVAGRCVWQSTSRGGVLALYYQTVMGLAPIYWNVLWVNDTTITVNGDVFYRRQ
ncbi:MAG TPA: hypothetical protein VHA07_13400 [Devosia sp.]|nr:hypothetical protein [Devosia sp.]